MEIIYYEKSDKVYHQHGRFRVDVSTSNVVHIDVDAESAADAERIVKGWIRENDPRFYNHFEGPYDPDHFDVDSVDADLV